MNGPEFDGEENRVDPLTGFSDTPREVGRPSELNNESLMHAAREIQHILEQNWGPVGEKLLLAKTPSDIGVALEQVEFIRSLRLELFTQRENRKASGDILRKRRKQLQELGVQIYHAALAQRYAREWHQRAQDDWCYESETERKKELELACSTWAYKSQDADQDLKELEADRGRLTQELRESEAYFAQSEILKFVRSKRREFTPSNVAAAMAGLPYLSARVSCERIRALKPQLRDGHAYHIFQIFQAMFAEYPRDIDSAVDGMRKYLIAEKRAKMGHVKELRKNWFSVEAAIRFNLKQPRGPRGSLPFRIFAEYTRKFTQQQRGDMVLAETRRIVLDGERPKLEGLPHWN